MTAVTCSGCGKPIGQRGDPPAENAAHLGYIHRVGPCREKAVRAFLAPRVFQMPEDERE